jgi:NAD(P)-dependent dehydrogenase (short-subunit alcohol dehydrogenase family)
MHMNRLVGWLVLTLDTLLQRILNWNARDAHPLFLPNIGPRSEVDWLTGKTAIVTGANTGIGLETARWLARGGATVVLACRSKAKAETAAANIRATCPQAKLEIGVLDLADFATVRAFALKFMSSWTGDDGAVADSKTTRPLHMLILNAGVMCVSHTDPETHFAVNHLAHALLTLTLLPALHAAAPVHARIVSVSSLSYMVSNLDLDDIAYARRPYRSFEAYANSKLCNALFTRALAQRLAGSGILCASVHPGEAPTNVSRHLGRFWSSLHLMFGPLFLLSPCEAARTAVYAAIVPDPGSIHAEAAVWRGEAVLHAGRRTYPIPSYLLAKADTERLWELTIASLGFTNAEKEVLSEVGLSLGSWKTMNETVNQYSKNPARLKEAK